MGSWHHGGRQPAPVPARRPCSCQGHLPAGLVPAFPPGPASLLAPPRPLQSGHLIPPSTTEQAAVSCPLTPLPFSSPISLLPAGGRTPRKVVDPLPPTRSVPCAPGLLGPSRVLPARSDSPASWHVVRAATPEPGPQPQCQDLRGSWFFPCSSVASSRRPAAGTGPLLLSSGSG